MSAEHAAHSAATEHVLAHPLVARLGRRLAARVPRVIELEHHARRAAVALTMRVRDDERVEVLLIRRAACEGDPWSGHIALPGGRHERGETLVQTAVRETREETAIDLERNGVVLGRMDDLQPRAAALPRLVITPFVAAVSGAGDVSRNDEVAESFWIPVETLRAPGATGDAVLELAGGPRRVACFRYRGHIIWGLTERILRQFLALAAEE